MYNRSFYPDWRCPNCKFNVFGSKTNCSKCKISKTDALKIKTTAKNANDWMCKTCNFLVFGSKTVCSKCNSQKPTCNTDNLSECKICFADSDKLVLNCGHTMCSSCVNTIKSGNNKCPYCKQAITSSIRIFDT